MSSPASGSHSWRRRHSSASSRNSIYETQAPASSPHPQRNPSNDAKQLSSSVGSASHREPIRSFIHGTVRGHLAPLDSAESARSVREDTAQLANYFLSDKKDARGTPFPSRSRSASSQAAQHAAEPGGNDAGATRSSETIAEVSEPPSPEATECRPQDGPSMLTTMFRKSPPDQSYFYIAKDGQAQEAGPSAAGGEAGGEHDTLTRTSSAEPRPLLVHRDTAEDAS